MQLRGSECTCNTFAGPVGRVLQECWRGFRKGSWKLSRLLFSVPRAVFFSPALLVGSLVVMTVAGKLLTQPGNQEKFFLVKELTIKSSSNEILKSVKRNPRRGEPRRGRQALGTGMRNATKNETVFAKSTKFSGISEICKSAHE